MTPQKRRPSLRLPAADARLFVTIGRHRGGIIPNATVTVTPQGTAAAPRSATTTDRGLATVADLTPGRYNVQAEFSGFDPGTLKNIAVRSGDNKHVIVITLKKLEESVRACSPIAINWTKCLKSIASTP